MITAAIAESIEKHFKRSSSPFDEDGDDIYFTLPDYLGVDDIYRTKEMFCKMHEYSFITFYSLLFEGRITPYLYKGRILYGYTRREEEEEEETDVETTMQEDDMPF
jgi:hypothetical protein